MSKKNLKKRKLIVKTIESSLTKRKRKEKRLKFYGIFSIILSFLFLFILFGKIFATGYKSFYQALIKIEVVYDANNIEEDNFYQISNNAINSLFPNVKSRGDKARLYKLFSRNVPHEVKKHFYDNELEKGSKVSLFVTASSIVDMFLKGNISKDVEESKRKLKNQQIAWIKTMQDKGYIKNKINTLFFLSGDSREAEIAGVAGSVIGSLLVILSCMALSFPLGVMTAIYLEEFAPKNILTEIIEVNVNNLAAVPSIIFGLLGLSIYLQFFQIPRSASLAGGLTLALMALPIIVISTRTSIRAIPSSIRQGALALGASKEQTTFHHVLPLAMPGIMTGTILSMARVLGETAPLLMIGMVAFIVDVPTSFFDPATAMPVQVYLWSDSPEIGFVEKTSGAIIILLLFLITANSLAVFLRNKFEVKW